MSKAKVLSQFKYISYDGCTVTLNKGWSLYEAITLAAIGLDDEEVASAIGELQKIQNSRTELKGNEVSK